MIWGRGGLDQLPLSLRGRTTGGGDAHDDYARDHNGVASALLKNLVQGTAHGGLKYASSYASSSSCSST